MRRIRTLPLLMGCLCAASVTLAAQQQRTPDQILQDIDRLIVELKTALQPPQPPDPVVRVVQPGESISAAIAAAAENATVYLAAGATYTENVRISRGRVTLRTLKALPEDARAVIQSTSNGVGVDITGSDVRIEDVHVRGTATTNALVMVGHADASQTTLDRVPQRVAVVGCVLEGVLGTKNALELHGADVAVLRNFIVSPGRVGQETHGIVGWNGPGPFTIDENVIDATSIGVLFGGADPTIPGLVPADIVITNNRISKDPARRGHGLVAKNHIEIKAGRRVTVRGNTLRVSWSEGQQGYAIVLTPAQYGANPTVSVEDVLIEANDIRQIGAGLQIMGNGQNSVTAQTQRVAFRNNYIQTDRATWGGQGWLALILREPRDVTFEQNTVEPLGVTQFIEATGGPVYGWRFVGNIVAPTGQYGLRLYAGGTMQNNATRWLEHFPGGIISGNAFVGSASTLRANLPENLHLSTADGAGLILDGFGTGALAPYGRQR